LSYYGIGAILLLVTAGALLAYLFLYSLIGYWDWRTLQGRKN